MKSDYKLTEKERKLIEENLNVVKFVINESIYYNNNLVGMSYEELYQVGCLALCEAVKTYNYSTKFNTYSSTVVRNTLFTYCKKVNLENERKIYLENITYDPSVIDSPLEFYDAYKILRSIKRDYKGVTQKGIIAIELKIKGFSGKEIAEMYGVSENNVGAWISRARKKLKTNDDLIKAIS